jgi:membrane-bound ClpP family serine protease
MSLVTALIEEALLVSLLLWVLPWLGASIPLWFVIVLALAWGSRCHLTYHLGKRLIGKRPAMGAETLVGARCRTATPLSPVGYLRVGSERWRACSTAGLGVRKSIVLLKGGKIR